MNKLQFNVDEDCLYSPILPDVVDISSESDDVLFITPGDFTQLEERFRINPAGSNLMSAFVGETTATLFFDKNASLEQDTVNIESGIQLERNLMELIGAPQSEQTVSPSSFTDNEFEEGKLFPWTMGNRPNETTNSYGRPTARTTPTPRTGPDSGGILPRPPA